MNKPFLSLRLIFTFLVVALILCMVHTVPAQTPRFMTPKKYIKANESAIQAVLEEADFQPGDKVADIGAGNGWFDLALATEVDSLTFYLEEIESFKINEDKLHKDRKTFIEATSKPITSAFTQILGTVQSTRLRDEFFDHVLLIETYHHFSHSDAMIKDIYRILKPGDLAMVYEVMAKRAGDIHLGCRSPIHSAEEIIADFESHGFKFRHMIRTKKNHRRQTGLFVFVK